MADVFISYHEKSAGELAAQIADTLEASGISCWYAKRDIPPGGDFAWHIPPQIDACKVFLLILNENAQKSRHIESEVGLAFSRWNNREEITILPLEIENLKQEPWLRYYLIHAQKLTMPVLDMEHMQELARQVVELLNREPKPPPTKIIQCGECGDNVTYTLDEKGILTIFGKGDMQNFSWDDETEISNTPWWNNRKTISQVEIKDGVTSIGNNAFSDCQRLIGVTIPNGVTSIGDYAFNDCERLISVDIPDSVNSIGISAFMGCTGLIKVTIPDSVTKLGDFAFWGCTASYSVPTKLTICNAIPAHHNGIERRT